MWKLLESKRNRVIFVLCGILLLSALDQLTKLWVIMAIPYGEEIPVIPGFFNLVHTQNRGAVFGIFHDASPEFQFWFFNVATLFLIGVLAVVVFRLRAEQRLVLVAMILILGGAIGNMIDRLRMGAVTDFLDFYVSAYHWPAFNVADSCIVIGAGLILVAMGFTHELDDTRF